MTRALGAMAIVGRTLASAGATKSLILMYHRVAEVESDPWSLCVAPQRFAEQMDALRSVGRPMPLRELTDRIRRGTVPRRAVAVTFDDGYADNGLLARPVLERLGIPATIFVASGIVGRDRAFWWDELHNLFLQPGVLPRVLRIDIAGATSEWDLGDAAQIDAAELKAHTGWKASDPPPTTRHDVYRRLSGGLKSLPVLERETVLARLREWSGKCTPARGSGPLSRQQVSELAAGGLIEVGAHTVTHPLLSARPLEEQAREIRASRTCLQEMIGQSVTSFAYPYGSRCDYTPETVELVRDAGFSCACTSTAGSVRRRADLFQLPRMHPQNWDGDEFVWRLSRWFASQ